MRAVELGGIEDFSWGYGAKEGKTRRRAAVGMIAACLTHRCLLEFVSDRNRSRGGTDGSCV
jgi:hypothetical protein